MPKIFRSASRELIGELLQEADAKAAVNEVLQAEGSVVNPITKSSIDRCIETYNRINAERGLAAMSLACHLYRFDNGDWPKSLDDLRTYMPGMPIDPWGDGTQTLGYVLIKRGLPDGSDRPLVYSRAAMKDGLFYRNDWPNYSWYFGDGSHRPGAIKNKADNSATWPDGLRRKEERPAATTQPLE